MGDADGGKVLTIIIPSFNDLRILGAIDSVRDFDDAGLASILVVDGGSHPTVVSQISERLTDRDVLISEPDQGIFDALNKGLDAVDTDFIGWIGSDDRFSGEVKSSEVLGRLKASDLFVGATAHVKGATVTRITPSWPARRGLVRYGLNNPHFSTFGRSELLKQERFRLGLRGSDIEYFLRVFARAPVVSATDKICTLMEEGGFSNSSYRAILRTNAELFRVYRAQSSMPIATLAIVVKLGFKVYSAALSRLLRRRNLALT